MERVYKRAHIRAPLHAHLLFEDEQFVFKTRALNISEGGILLENVPHLPNRDEISLMFDLPYYPALSKCTKRDLVYMAKVSMPKKIFRAKAKIVRRSGETVAVDDVFKQGIGCQFFEIGEELRKEIRDYVVIVKRNLEYLLGLYEKDDGDQTLLGLILDILGYESGLDPNSLKEKVLRDYQSMN